MERERKKTGRERERERKSGKEKDGFEVGGNFLTRELFFCLVKKLTFSILVNDDVLPID